MKNLKLRPFIPTVDCSLPSRNRIGILLTNINMISIKGSNVGLIVAVQIIHRCREVAEQPVYLNILS